ncbi:hypothetical protein A0U40_17855 [[Bacillus] sp. KCTC 13219]|nr:hypothetical protein A0U40_17855 [[Bacillus] sp. KCTC 13219]
MPLEQIREEIKRKQAGMVTLGQAIAEDVTAEAKLKASWTDRTSNTRNAIHGGVDAVGDEVIVYVAHGSEVGAYHETGTGIYGPKKRPIRPVKAKVLRFKFNGKEVFARSVKGIKKNPVLLNAVNAKMPKIEEAIKEYWST